MKPFRTASRSSPMNQRIGTGLLTYTRRSFLRKASTTAGALALAPLLAAVPSAAEAKQSPVAQSTLLVYTTTGGLGGGDFSHVATIGMLQEVLATFPADWLVSGVGATDWDHRIGELIPGGMAGDLPVWWADPDSPSQSALVDLRTDPRGPTAHFPFVAMAIGDPAEASTFALRDVPDLHAGIREQLAAADLEFAGVQVEGAFGPVHSRVAYNFPTTGVPPDFVPEDVFRFIDYSPAPWRMYGLYTQKPDLQQVVYTSDPVQQGLHLHGYTTGLRRGGHILGGVASNARATVWPVSQMVIRYGAPSPAM